MMQRFSTRISLLVLLIATVTVGCKPEGFINKTDYQGKKVSNYCQDFEEEVAALVEANQGISVLRVSQYDNSQFNYFYLEPGQMEQIGDTLYVRFVNDIQFERYLHKGVAVQAWLSYRAQDHLRNMEAEPEGEFGNPLIIDRAYYDANKEPFFVYKFPVANRVNGKQITLHYSIVQYKNGKLKKTFCNSVEVPLGPLDASCCTDQAWRNTNAQAVVRIPDVDIKPEDYRYQGFTGTLDLIFPMNSVKYDQEELNNVILNYIKKYEEVGFAVRNIDMIGYASQGGTVDYNQKLSEGRTQAVFDHLLKHFEKEGRTDVQVSHRGMGEDWERFELLVKTAVFTDQERAELLAIAQSPAHPDEKEAQLRKLPYWNKLIKEVLVFCRHVFINFNFEYKPDKMYVETYPSKMPVISPELYNVATKKMTITRYTPNSGIEAQSGLSILNTLIDVNSNRRANLFAMRSTYFFALNNVKMAISDIEAALQQESDNLQYGLAALSYKTKFADNYSLQERMNMLADYNSFTLKYPNNENLQFNRVVMMEKVGYISGALAAYSGLISKESKSAAALNNRGVALMKTNRLLEAESDFTEAIKLDPKLAEAYFNLAILYAYKGLPSKAISNLSKAVELNPGLREGLFSNPAFQVIKSNPEFTQKFR